MNTINDDYSSAINNNLRADLEDLIQEELITNPNIYETKDQNIIEELSSTIANDIIREISELSGLYVDEDKYKDIFKERYHFVDLEEKIENTEKIPIPNKQKLIHKTLRDTNNIIREIISIQKQIGPIDHSKLSGHFESAISHLTIIKSEIERMKKRKPRADQIRKLFRYELAHRVLHILGKYDLPITITIYEYDGGIKLSLAIKILSEIFQVTFDKALTSPD